MTGELVPTNPGEFLFYQTEDGQPRVEVRIQDETVWLSQKGMAELFGKDVRTVQEHIRNLFDEGELQPGSVIRNFRITADESNYPEFSDSLNGRNGTSRISPVIEIRSTNDKSMVTDEMDLTRFQLGFTQRTQRTQRDNQGAIHGGNERIDGEDHWMLY